MYGLGQKPCMIEARVPFRLNCNKMVICKEGAPQYRFPNDYCPYRMQKGKVDTVASMLQKLDEDSAKSKGG